MIERLGARPAEDGAIVGLAHLRAVAAAGVFAFLPETRGREPVDLWQDVEGMV